MAVEVKLPILLRPHAGGASIVESAGSTVEEVLGDLEARYPGLTSRIRGGDGALSRFVNVYVGEENARLAGGLAAPVADGQTVTIIPAVAGG
ncbi:MAG: MoaD/ThiS family protein [Actinomycetota bacterium]|nr:MoaD/ThiS family protein [Actinomycetota bacterium]